MISWQYKKQTMVANSIKDAEYVVASSCCGQVLWIQNQLLDYGYNFMHIIKTEREMCDKNRQSDLVKTVNEEVQLQALVDGKKIIITEATVGLFARIDSSYDEASLGDQENASKHGRKIHDIGADEDITLENVHAADMFGLHDLDGDKVFVETEEPVVNACPQLQRKEEDNAALLTWNIFMIGSEVKDKEGSETREESSSKRAGVELE
ncbi:hypothetical protein Tco_1215341 [Tanacetum coccineum]